MLRRALTAVVVMAALLAGPAAAWAQDPPLTDEPPTPLDGDATPTPTAEPTAEPTATPAPDGPDADDEEEELADTGSEPAYVALSGLALLLAGCGVRLRLGPDDQLLG